MNELIKQMPFSVISLYFAGDAVKAVAVGDDWQLQGKDFVLVGLEGKPYAFSSVQNAEYWLESNLIRTAQALKTDAAAVLRLEEKRASLLEKKAIDAYWITEEITQIEARNAQAEGVIDDGWHTWGDLFIDGGTA